MSRLYITCARKMLNANIIFDCTTKSINGVHVKGYASNDVVNLLDWSQID